MTAVITYRKSVSIKAEKVTSRGRFSQGSFALGTKMAWMDLGDRDKLIEEGLD